MPENHECRTENEAEELELVVAMSTMASPGALVGFRVAGSLEDIESANYLYLFCAEEGSEERLTHEQIVSRLIP